MEILSYIENMLTDIAAPDTVADVKGNYRFHFAPTFTGQAPLNTHTILLFCFEDAEKRAPVEFTAKWCKIMDNDVYEIKDYAETYYHVNPSDIDLKIRAIVTSKCPKHPGTAILTVGPIVLDGSIKPELEGMVLNKAANFRCTFISLNQEKISPNLSLLKVEKPIMRILFDPKMVNREPDAKKELFQNIEFDFEKDTDLKVKVDSHNINNIIIQYKRGGFPQILLAKFDSRMQRDLFYIYLKLMRMLRSKILEDMDGEYEKLLSMPWCFLKAGSETDRYDELRGYQALYSADIVRETLKEMVRYNKALQEENVNLIDSVHLLEQDLRFAVTEFEELLKDGRNKNTKNLRKFERSHRSILQESTVILDGIKIKSKKQKRENEESIIEATRSIQDEVASIKKINEILKKEIEVHKGAPKIPTTGTGSSTAPKMDSLFLSVIQVRSRLCSKPITILAP